MTSDERPAAQSLLDALGTALDPIWDRVALHKRLQDRLSKILPPALMRHIKVSCIEGDTLILFCDTAAWASDTRYRESEILKSVNSCERLRLTRCRVLVRAELFHQA